jgi:hypothetical protein
MLDNGTAGDELDGDGVFTACIPGRASGQMVAFWVSATNSLGVSQQYPSTEPLYPGDTIGRECLVRFGDPQPGGTMGIYRIWMSQATYNAWISPSRKEVHNGLLDVTFVCDSNRVVYCAGASYSGSEGGSTLYDTPTGMVCGYNIAFPKDDRFLGATEMLLDLPQLDTNGQREVLAYWIASQMELPFNHRRYVRVIVNGVENNTRWSNYGDNATVYMDSQQPDSDVISQWFPEDEDGELFKIHHWFTWYDWPISGGTQFFAKLEPYTNSAGVMQAHRYRWNLKHRAVKQSANDYTNLFRLVDTVNTNDQA